MLRAPAAAGRPFRLTSGDTGSRCSRWCFGEMPSCPTWWTRGRFTSAQSRKAASIRKGLPVACPVWSLGKSSRTLSGHLPKPIPMRRYPRCATRHWSCFTGFLFVLYAEDRDLLPVRDSRYDDYALRERVRGDIGRRKDQGDVFFLPRRLATGRRSTISAVRSTRATPRSACRPTTVGCSTARAHRCSRVFG